MRAQPPHDAASGPSGLNQGANHGFEVGRGEDIRQRVDKGRNAGDSAERTGEILGAGFVPPGIQWIGLDIRQIELFVTEPCHDRIYPLPVADVENVTT